MGSSAAFLRAIPCLILLLEVHSPQHLLCRGFGGLPWRSCCRPGLWPPGRTAAGPCCVTARAMFGPVGRSETPFLCLKGPPTRASSAASQREAPAHRARAKPTLPSMCHPCRLAGADHPRPGALPRDALASVRTPSAFLCLRPWGPTPAPGLHLGAGAPPCILLVRSVLGLNQP